jgi:hypothetical protein
VKGESNVLSVKPFLGSARWKYLQFSLDPSRDAAALELMNLEVLSSLTRWEAVEFDTGQLEVLGLAARSIL